MEPRGTVRLWRDNSNMGKELEESLCDHGWIVKTIITGSTKPVASQEAGAFAHGYPAIKSLFSLSEPCFVNDLSDETKRCLLAGDGEVLRMWGAEFHEMGPNGELTAVAEEPDDDDDDDWDDDDDEDWDDDEDDLDDDEEEDDLLDLMETTAQIDTASYRELAASYRELAKTQFKKFVIPNFNLHLDDLKPVHDISELEKGDLITIADTVRTSVENELVWKITHDEIQQGILARVTTACGAIMVVKLQQGDVCTKVGHIDEDDDWLNSASTKTPEIYRSDISVLKKGDFIVLKNYYRGRKWEVMQDGEGQQAISLQCECVHEDGCGASVGFTTLRMGDYWRKVGRIDEPDIMTPFGAADIKETSKPNDRRDDIFKQMFNQ